MNSDSLHFYADLGEWWPPEEYEEEAAFFLAKLSEACERPPGNLLELGSGGGSNAVHMKAAFDEVVLTDLSPAMLEPHGP